MLPIADRGGPDRFLRHVKIAVTMKIYPEIPQAAARDLLKKLGQWLGS
jgi:hypothetical protein